MCNSRAAFKPTPNGDLANVLQSRESTSQIPEPDHNTLVSSSEINDNDVLCGRGAGAANHVGNRRFRQLVSAYHGAYHSCRILEKARIAECIVDTVKASVPSGRFLKRSEDKTGYWHVISNKSAIEKTSQALREKGPGTTKTVADTLRTEGAPQNDASRAYAGGCSYLSSIQDVKTENTTTEKANVAIPVVSNHSSPVMTAGIPTSAALTNTAQSPLTLYDSQRNDGGTPTLQSFNIPFVKTTESITDNDVLCGRGGVTNSHIGNIRFRELVREHQKTYLTAPKKEKTAIAQRIVDIIRHERHPPGRFLIQDKRVSTGNTWIDVGDDRAREKASQALREKAPEMRGVYSAAARLLGSKSEWNAEASSGPAQQTTTGPESGAGGVPLVSMKDGHNGPSTTPTPHLNEPQQEPHPQESFSATMPIHQLHSTTTGFTLTIAPRQIDELDAGKSSDGKPILIPLGSVNENDVLYGRGAGINNQTGNRRFRLLVQENQEAYVASPKLKKVGIAKMIVDTIRRSDPPGRFLVRTTIQKDGGGIEEKWVDVGDARAREKTSQALRENAQQIRAKLLSDSEGPRVPTEKGG